MRKNLPLSTELHMWLKIEAAHQQRSICNLLEEIIAAYLEQQRQIRLREAGSELAEHPRNA